MDQAGCAPAPESPNRHTIITTVHLPPNATKCATFQAHQRLSLPVMCNRASTPVLIRMAGLTMHRSFRLKRVHKLARDFVCSLVVFSALFVVMSPSGHRNATIPIVSLFGGSMATAADYRLETVERATGGPRGAAVHRTFIAKPLSATNMPLISTILALVFSSIMAFNLALLRHLRRVNASSRRGVWREG
jgi:hypothetical protein